MRCILTVNFSPWSRYSGGGQRSTHNLARALAARGHSVAVVFTKPPWERVPLPASLPYEVSWAALPALRSRSAALLRPSTPWFVARRVQELLARDAAPAVVHGNGEEAALVGELRRLDPKRRFGFVMTPRYPALPTALFAERARRSLARRAWLALAHTKYLLLGRALRAADVICPTSAFAAGLVARAYGLSRAAFEVIPNGVSDEFLRAGAEPNAPRSPHAPAGEFAIYFGRLAREKGVHTILDALARVRSLPLEFVFAGRGPELASLQARVRALGLEGRVRFITWLDAPELAALVRNASCAVLPSLEESFGNTMAEAMALSVPVISTTAGSIPELVSDERTGVLVPPDDPSALARALDALAANAAQRHALASAAREYVRANLSWDASAQRFERVYERALAAS